MSVSYELRTAAGAAIKTFDDRQAALKRARDACHTFPGAYVVEITRPEPIVRRIWSDRARLALVAS